MEVLAYDNEYCPSLTRTTNTYCPLPDRVPEPAQTLIAENTFELPASYGQAMACVLTRVVEIGTHADTSLDFEHKTGIERNAAGQVLAVRSLGPQGDWTLQQIDYGADAQVRTIGSPGEGTSSVDYDPATHLARTVTSPDGSLIQVASPDGAFSSARDPVTDAILTMRRLHGTLAYQQCFRFDGQERLSKQWDDLGSPNVTENNPNLQLAYRYATATQPGSISQARLVDAEKKIHQSQVDLVTAAGENVGTVQRVPEGWAFGTLVNRSRSQEETWKLWRPTIGPATDVTALAYSTLYADTRLLADTITSALGPVADTIWYHADVQRRLVTTLAVENGQLVQTTEENGDISTTHVLDAKGRVLSYMDGGGATYTYRHDALGRLREVILPDGTHHRQSYDAYGRTRRIERENIPGAGGRIAIEYSYYEVSGLPKEKRWLSASQETVSTTTYGYDGIGRVKLKREADVGGKVARTYRYFYDGATPAHPSDVSTPGFLTGIEGDGHQKVLQYRADGAVRRRTVVLNGWRTVETSFSYLDSGDVAERVTTVYAGSGEVLSTSSHQFREYNEAGQLIGTSIDNKPFAQYSYNEDNQLQGVVLANNDSTMLMFDDWTRRVRGSVQIGGSWNLSTIQ